MITTDKSTSKHVIAQYPFRKENHLQPYSTLYYISVNCSFETQNGRALHYNILLSIHIRPLESNHKLQLTRECREQGKAAAFLEATPPWRCYDNRSSYYAAREVEDWRSERDLMMGEVGVEQRTMAMFCYPAGRKQGDWRLVSEAVGTAAEQTAEWTMEDAPGTDEAVLDCCSGGWNHGTWPACIQNDMFAFCMPSCSIMSPLF